MSSQKEAWTRASPNEPLRAEIARTARRVVGVGVTVCFFDEKDRISEPCILIGRVTYQPDQDPAEACRAGEGWDLWHAFFDWSQPVIDSAIRTVERDDGRIVRVDLVAAPLFSINGLDDVTKWMVRIRELRVTPDAG